MSFQRIVSLAALVAATFVFVDSASSQPRAPAKAPTAASAAQPKGMQGMTAQDREQHRKEMHDRMHGDQSANGKDDAQCMGMMGKRMQMAKGHDAKDHADHADHDKTAAAKGCGGMGKMH
jgi:hypothetical protein